MKKIDVGQTITILANLGVITGIVLLAFEIRRTMNCSMRKLVLISAMQENRPHS